MDADHGEDRPNRPNAFAPHKPSNLSQTKFSKSPFSPPQRSATYPSSPPSPEPLAQDSAFPIFPTTRSRSATPTTPSEPTRPATFEQQSLQPPRDDFGVFAPINDKRAGRDDVMQRLNALSPGPFDTNKSRGHRKNPASGSSMEDFIRSPNRHSPHSSNASSNHRRDLSQSSTWSQKSSDRLKPMPGALGNTGRSESAGAYSAEPLPKSTKPPPSLAKIGRSQTSPVESGLGSYASIDATSRQTVPEKSPPKPSRHRPQPSVAAANRPLDEIGSMSSFKSSRSLRGRKETPAANSERLPAGKTEVRNDGRYQDAPPVPKPSRALEFGVSNPYHFSTESNSSNDSSASEVRTASSRSSPPLSESPQRMKRKADTSRLDNLMNDFKFDLEPTPPLEQPVSLQGSHAPSFSRPINSRLAEAARDGVQVKVPTGSSQSTFQNYRRPSDDDLSPLSPPPQATFRDYPASEPSRPPPSRAPRQPPPNKGSCRGCGDLIFGKSVSSADGRLTGRYHKSCFVCETCKEPFQTADFYVIRNQPYCAQHYHELNDSLCTQCNHGIEGQYLETEVKQKYHPTCFTCQVSLGILPIAFFIDANDCIQDCQRPLRDDYFEMNGKTYCEQHAFRAAQRTQFLGPGRRHPERRTTRLMMM